MNTVQPATAAELPAIRALVEMSRLPVADLDTAAIDWLAVQRAHALVGVVGVERFGRHGLLRSLAVAESSRGAGIGDALVQAAEHHARDRGLDGLVLLTTTAAPFFARRGYATIDRATVPADVQRSAEFRTICPASAVCMIKSLESAA